MSFHVSLYAEYRSKGSAEWKLLHGRPITPNFKQFMEGDPNDCTVNDRFNSFNDIDVQTLSGELYNKYKKSIESNPRFITFKAISIDEYDSRIAGIISNHRNLTLHTLTALGFHAFLDDDGIVSVSDNWTIDDTDTAKSVERKRGLQMTLPVFKELIYQAVVSHETYARALQNQGIIDTIREAIPYSEQDNTEIRLVLVS